MGVIVLIWSCQDFLLKSIKIILLGLIDISKFYFIAPHPRYHPTPNIHPVMKGFYFLLYFESFLRGAVIFRIRKRTK